MKRNYEFSVQVTGLDIENKSQLKQLKNDTITVVPFASDGLIMLGIELAAESPESAFIEFKSFLNKCASNIKIKRVDLDLVSLSQIAERLNVTREAVRLWATGERRQDFPAPFTSAGQSLLWAWSDVFDWLTEEEIQDDPLPLPINLIERSNGVYAQDRKSVAPRMALASALRSR
ncbi:MAG: hypothetical protein Q8K86_06330 [Candidatus Nanopelagicaceae bacterium]|nr:hypothetical protein [Candidatus Nanopelagicaceae bacterium]